MESPDARPKTAKAGAAARRIVRGFGPREIGIAVLAVAALAVFAVWQGRSRQRDAEVAAIRTQLALRIDAADVYRDGYAAVAQDAAQMRSWAESQRDEPLRTWARERARRMDALLAAVDRESQARAFARQRKEIEQLCRDGDVARARAALAAVTPPTFPGPAEFARVRAERYETPLAAFSRQTPDFYRAFRQFEPTLARQDEQALRAEIQAASSGAVTPQLMLKVDLLGVVAAADDPLVTEWAAVAAAMDYFDSPDGVTLGRWRRAQHAIQAKDWPSATAEMQAIVDSKVRTRQPFRAAFGRALIHSRPDDPVAYACLAEAAAAGDKEARRWVAEQDVKRGRTTQARRWLEASLLDGDPSAAAPLLQLYASAPQVDPADARHEAGVLQRVADREDAPAAALVYLGWLYEQGAPPGSSPSKAFACYARAAAKGSGAGKAEVARCALRGIGVPENLDQARDAAAEAFQAGEREPAAATLLELMRRAPERTAGAVQRMFEQEQVGSGGGYTETRTIDGPGVSQLRAALAHYLDAAGQYRQAARFYAGTRDPAAQQRRAELTAVHACETCGGLGKVTVTAPCPTCGGKGRQVCGFCGGTGYIFVPGTPPCPTCGGSGTMVQDRRVVACSACGGTGKGKGNVIKQDCTHCDHGFVPCPECTGGVIKLTKECPECHGRGAWSLVDRGT